MWNKFTMFVVGAAAGAYMMYNHLYKKAVKIAFTAEKKAEKETK